MKTEAQSPATVSVCSSPPVRVEDSDGLWQTSAVFTGEEIYFEDHFPGFPIVPGVLLLEAMRECSQVVLGREVGKVRLVRCTHVRLIRPCIPPVTVNVLIRVKESQNEYETRCEVQNGDEKRLASARFYFELENMPCSLEVE